MRDVHVREGVLQDLADGQRRGERRDDERRADGEQRDHHAPEPRRAQRLRDQGLDRASVPSLERLEVVGRDLRHGAHQRGRAAERREVLGAVAAQEPLVRARRVLDHGAAEEEAAALGGAGDRPDAARAGGGHAVAAVSEERHAAEVEGVLQPQHIVAARALDADVRVWQLAEAHLRVEEDALTHVVRLVKLGQHLRGGRSRRAHAELRPSSGRAQGRSHVLPEAAVDCVARVDDPEDVRPLERGRCDALGAQDRVEPEVEAARLT